MRSIIPCGFLTGDERARGVALEWHRQRNVLPDPAVPVLQASYSMQSANCGSPKVSPFTLRKFRNVPAFCLLNGCGR